ncbi:MAG: thiol:disulfide interchange protein DsbD [Acidobacteria bacterium]|nr:thiol:disulfide interchange protein DsbD [Acidobacteriota bacterium]
MSRRNQLLIISFVTIIFPLGLAACSQTASGPAAPTPAKLVQVNSLSFVKARAAEMQVAAGGSGEAIVTVAVQSGYHVNANPATDAYLKATELIVQPAEGLTLAFIKYPTAVKKTFSFSDKQLAVYEGEIPIKVQLKAGKEAAKGSHKLVAKLNVQACDDQLCYPPGTLELTIPVTVK